MKRLVYIPILLVFLLSTLFSFSSCSKQSVESGIATTEAPSTTETVNSETSANQTMVSESTIEGIKQKEPFQIKVLGTIYQLYETKEPLVSSLNLKLSCADHIYDLYNTSRCIFNTESILIVNVESPKITDLSATITPHNENSTAYYGKYESPYATWDFLKSDDSDKIFAVFPLDSSAYPAGYYDIVIMLKGKPITVVMIKLLEEDGIQKSKN